MVQAATEGVIDFRNADMLDSRWQRQVQFLLQGLVRKNNRDAHRARADYYGNAMTVDGISADGYTTLRDSCVAAVTKYCDTFTPWVKQKRNPEVDAVQRLREAWQQRFGRFDDPKTQEKIQRTVDFMRAKRARNRRGKNRMERAQQLLSAMRSKEAEA